MMISDESVFLSLAVGVVLGLFLLGNKVIVAGKRGKGAAVFLADFTFAALAVVLTFIASIPISKGRIRFFQAALELIGMLSVSLAASDVALRLLRLLRKKKNALALFWKRKRDLFSKRRTEKKAERKAAHSKRKAERKAAPVKQITGKKPGKNSGKLTLLAAQSTKIKEKSQKRAKKS